MNKASIIKLNFSIYVEVKEETHWQLGLVVHSKAPNSCFTIQLLCEAYNTSTTLNLSFPICKMGILIVFYLKPLW